MTSGLSPAVRLFVRTCINSVEELEILLLLRSSAPRAWTAQEVSAELRTQAGSAQRRLDELRHLGLVVEATESSSTYRFQTSSPELEEGIRLLADAYSERRVAVIAAIYDKPSDGIQSFADAFVVRKGKADG